MPKSLKENMSNTGQCLISGLHNYQNCSVCAKWQNGEFGSEMKKNQKHTKNDSTTTFELLYAKSSSKKHPIFEK